MKHKTIITRLCYFLNEGYGINKALAELGLTPTYLTERCRRTDRVKLHQAHQIYREGLEREIVQRARLGRDITRLERALNNLPFLSLPGDDEDEERVHRRWERRNFPSDVDDDFNRFVPQGAAVDVGRLVDLGRGDVEDFEDEEDASEASSAPRSRPQTSVTPFAALSARPPEDANRRRPEPEPEPKLTWYRLFTGRAQLRDEDGNVVRTVMPGQSGYPHERQFINWK